MLLTCFAAILMFMNHLEKVLPQPNNDTASPTTSVGCEETRSQPSGAYVYHIFANCQGDYAAATSKCSEIKGQLAVLRDANVIRTVAETAGYKYREQTLARTFWTGSAINLPGLDSELFLGGTCGLLSFGENPLSELPQVNWTLTNDCESIEEAYPWLCETVVENYSIEETLTKSEPKSTGGSVMDYRPSAICIGSGGLAFLVVTIALIAIMDLQRLLSSSRSGKANAHKNKHKNSDSSASNDSSIPICLDRYLNGPVIPASGWTTAAAAVKTARQPARFSVLDPKSLGVGSSDSRMPNELTTSDISLQDEGFSSGGSSVV
ncbi:hypothetical protein EGW08_010702 [Elysia chlorotica]|uniref:C-type lectin domain-containing protein n=1 Tax=Elysia chlorotica TaxID=188477 RepID=A0A433TIW3_ELYCH|nr:hypothetical protein EGW08_010702 [Elysia chlorotica]